MKYMGGKQRLAKHIVPILKEYRKHNQPYWEPFVGGANILSEMGGHRIGSDIHPYLIRMWRAVSVGWMPDEDYNEETYKLLMTHPETNPPLAGYIGFVCSWGGKWKGGWARDGKGKRNYAQEGYRAALKQFPKLRGVLFVETSYDAYNPLPGTLIYCDPPYKGTTKYKDSFDSEKFWAWCDTMVEQGHTIIVSEYQAPPGWECIWDYSHFSSLRGGEKERVERLYVRNN